MKHLFIINPIAGKGTAIRYKVIIEIKVYAYERYFGKTKCNIR